ncbi:hypothetical protein DL96DRAFT_1821477 [Flagelloscypha sp. PMI_526]|nr:hypothetical protein DL96DRAFT_1821477 [Flagelloscypha sp. PMI_526]
MATVTSSFTPISLSSENPLPLDVIFIIFDFTLLSSQDYKTILQLLLLSRAVYQWMIPRLYHTLGFRKYDVTSPGPYTIDRNVFFTCAPTSSLLFTRRIFSPDLDSPLSFSLFPQLTHLSLWGCNCLNLEPHGTKQAQAIMSLPLEELLVIDSRDNLVLLRILTEDVTIWRTLQRFSCFSHAGCNRPDEGWLQCPNLAQVLVLCVKVEWFIDTQIKGVVLPSSTKLQSYLVSPIWGSSMLPPGDTLELPVKDSRITILRKSPRHYVERPGSFWDNHSDMWTAAQHMIRKNLDVQETRVIRKLPWSKAKHCYIVS